ncbi:MAG TPA: hypothetical protein VGN12_25825 [Pirellulales bacterium]|jgi:hypothetical protein
MAKSSNADPFSSVPGIIERIESTGEILGDRASQLSNIIAAIASRLDATSGKVEARAHRDGITVAFERRKRWGLWLIEDDYDEQEPHDLTTVSIAQKAQAFPVLLILLQRIAEQQVTELAEVSSALSLLTSEGK